MKAAIEYLEYRRNGLRSSLNRSIGLYPEIDNEDRISLKEINSALKLLKKNI